MNVPKLGELVTGDTGRDAIHIALLPRTAVRVLRPGEHMKYGVVDPFLKEPVQPGQRYLLMLYPNTISDLRHVWTHPGFDDEPPETLPPSA